MESFNTALQCGSFLIPWNAVMLALGILTAIVVSEILVKKRGLDRDLALDCCIVSIPCGVVGARVFSALSGKIAWEELFSFTRIGMNLPGALLLSSIGVLLYCRVKKYRAGTVFDALLPAAFFGLAVGRWSDFFLCDGLGPVAGDVPKFFPLVTYTSLYFADHSTVAYAVFFADFLVCLALGVAALLIEKRSSVQGRAARITAALYLILEFVLEWLRDGSTRQIVFGSVRFNQIVLFMMLVLFVLVLIFRAKAGKRKTAEASVEEEEAQV